MAKAARPRKVKADGKYSDELAEKAINLARQGAYRSNVAKLCGISRETLYRWLADEAQPYADFAAKFLEAEAEAEQELADAIRNSPDPIDKKWFLSRRYPERWGERKQIAMSGGVDMGVKLDASAFADDSAREHVLGFIQYIFASDTDDEPEPGDAGESGDE